MLYRIILITCGLMLFSVGTFAFDSTNDATVDKADRFDFENFHKDSATTTWSTNKKKDDKTVTTYEEPKPNAPTSASPSIKQGDVIESETISPQSSTPAATKAPVETNRSNPPATAAKTNIPSVFEKGQELKVREAYKLSSDPSLKNIPTLFEAIENLHKQLNGYCPNGWKKEEEWHKPEASYFYIHYRAICQ